MISYNISEGTTHGVSASCKSGHLERQMIGIYCIILPAYIAAKTFLRIPSRCGASGLSSIVSRFLEAIEDLAVPEAFDVTSEVFIAAVEVELYKYLRFLHKFKG